MRKLLFLFCGHIYLQWVTTTLNDNTFLYNKPGRRQSSVEGISLGWRGYNPEIQSLLSRGFGK
jgi:hypothetical protein